MFEELILTCFRPTSVLSLVQKSMSVLADMDATMIFNLMYVKTLLVYP